jgi:hypothetical protein
MAHHRAPDLECHFERIENAMASLLRKLTDIESIALVGAISANTSALRVKTGRMATAPPRASSKN